ncbi:MAG: HopJ type III effector protein [Colwellia sp.]|nr:HopJ type III effector protein [Colwellia sp.]
MLENKLILKIKQQPLNVNFDEVIQVIEDNYQYTPTLFINGALENQASTNEGSCKIFSFAKLHALSQEQTLNCFGRYYREDVLGYPNGTDHGNIRNFINSGWDGLKFSSLALKASKKQIAN